jgi:hypothetical protein
MSVGNGRGVAKPALCERIHELGETKVDDLHVAVVCDQQVLGLEVAMNDAVLVHFGQRIAGLDGPVERPSQLHRAIAKHVAQRTSLDVLHRDVGPVVDLTDVVNRRDVRMVDRRGQPGFLKKPLAPGLVAREVRADQFERGPALQLEVFDEKDLAHSAFTEALDHPVMTNSCAQYGGLGT